MSSIQKTVGLLIKGVGHDEAYPNGVLWCFGEAPPVTSVTQDYYWHTIGIDPPSTIDTYVSWWSGQLSTNAVDVTLAFPDPLVAKFLLSVQDRSKNSLAFAASKTTTTLFLTGPDQDSYENTAIWVGDETIFLGERTLTGTYINCVRGFYSTTPQAHAQGRIIYDRPQYLKYREATLFEYNWSTNQLQTLVRCYVDQIFNDGPTVTITTQELSQLLEGATVNRESPKIPVDGQLIPLGGLGLTLDGTFPHRSNILRGNGTTWMQIGDTIIPCDYDASLSVITPMFPPSAIWSDAPPIEPDNDDAVDYVSNISTTLRELFIVMRSYFADPRSLASSKALPVTSYRHPIGLYYGFVRSGVEASTHDGWLPNWGIGLPESWCDDAGIQDLILKTQDANIDQLILGWDGDDPTLGDLWQILGHPYGFILAPKKDGTISFARISALDIEAFINADTVNILPGHIQQDPVLDGAFSSVIAKIGKMPWSDPDSVTVASRDGTLEDTTRKAIFDTVRELTYDFQTQYQGKGREEIVSTLLGRVLQGIQSVNQVTIKVLDDDDLNPGYKNFDIGSWIRVQCLDPVTQQSALETKVWVDQETGELVHLGVSAKFAGILVGRSYDITTSVWTLTLLMQSSRSAQFARYRAPSGVITDQGGATTLTLTPEFSSELNEHFTVGDVVDIAHPDGTLFEGPFTITNITGSVIELDVAASTVTVGMVLRLSTFLNYGSGGDPLNGSIRAFVFAADTTTELIQATDSADLFG